MKVKDKPKILLLVTSLLSLEGYSIPRKPSLKGKNKGKNKGKIIIQEKPMLANIASIEDIPALAGKKSVPRPRDRHQTANKKDMPDKGGSGDKKKSNDLDNCDSNLKDLRNAPWCNGKKPPHKKQSVNTVKFTIYIALLPKYPGLGKFLKKIVSEALVVAEPFLVIHDGYVRNQTHSTHNKRSLRLDRPSSQVLSFRDLSQDPIHMFLRSFKVTLLLKLDDRWWWQHNFTFECKWENDTQVEDSAILKHLSKVGEQELAASAHGGRLEREIPDKAIVDVTTEWPPTSNYSRISDLNKNPPVIAVANEANTQTTTQPITQTTTQPITHTTTQTITQTTTQTTTQTATQKTAQTTAQTDQTPIQSTSPTAAPSTKTSIDQLIPRDHWYWQRFVGLGLFLLTTVTVFTLTLVSSIRQRRRVAEENWVNLATQEGMNELLSTDWKVQSGSQPVLVIFQKERLEYLDDDSILLGGYEHYSTIVPGASIT